jgi:hypothetical protein
MEMARYKGGIMKQKITSELEDKEGEERKVEIGKEIHSFV